MIKLALKDWHRRHSKNLPAKIVSLKGKIFALDFKGESAVLLDGEVEKLHELTEELFSVSRTNNNICWQL